MVNLYHNYGTIKDSSLTLFGGYYGYTPDVGAFFLFVNYSATTSNTNVGYRLMFL